MCWLPAGGASSPSRPPTRQSTSPGANAILLYLLDRFVDFDRIFLLLFSDIALMLDDLAGPGAARLVANLAGLCLAVAIAWALYVNRVFLRV